MWAVVGVSALIYMEALLSGNAGVVRMAMKLFYS